MTPPAAAAPATRALAPAILALALGHVFSNAVRTLPAVAADLLERDLGLAADELAAITGIFPLAFAAAMVPVGVALDRYGVKPVALILLAIASAGAAAAALAPGPLGMALAQAVLGIGCSGMLMGPMTFAAKALPPARFALWSGLIQTTGNTGMLLSASPLAWLVEAAGWRAGYAVAAAFAVLAALLVAAIVRERPPRPRDPAPSAWTDAREVVALGLSRRLRAPVVLALASFAAVLGVRGLWGGPWLMEVKGMPRIAAGNLLLFCTLALTLGPTLAGWLARQAGGRERTLLAGGHLAAAGLLALLLLGGPGGPFGAFPAALDAALLAAFGLAIGFQVLAFPMVRAAVVPEQTGRALSAMNIAYFGGAAALQAVSGAAAAAGGAGAAIASFVLALVLCTAAFLMLSRPSNEGTHR
ncbi:MFS transporter [Caldovatus aquaticus]|uniref:MFS transporter n=1 Tax=Caldovatus aquaticus TaxID=2865671 RepID=A0ABS7EYI7_9PROT|nr:MFS transporter [Caldovatus aquaticus]MBW8268425.1 MFS transporter [Caldovatus aquaticus]